MAVALREFFFPIERPLPERKPSPYPEPRRPSGVRPPATEAEAAAAAVKVIFGPLNWVNEQRAIDKRARAWKQVSFGGRFGQDPSGQDYTLDFRGGWRQFLTHPVKGVKKAAKSLVIRKAYDAMQTSALQHYHDLWQMGRLSQQEYIKFIGRANDTLKWIGPRDWMKDPATGDVISTGLRGGSGRLWEWMDFIDNPIGYTMRKVVWKKGVKPAISKVTKPVTEPVRKFAREKIKAPIKKKITDPVKEKVKEVARKVWEKIKKRLKKIQDEIKKQIRQKIQKEAWRAIKKVGKKLGRVVSKAAKKAAKTIAKKAGQAAAKILRKVVSVLAKVVQKVAVQVAAFVARTVTSLAASAASAVSAPAIAVIAVVVILLLLVLALITTIGTHSAFLPPGLGPPLPGERFVQLRKLIYHETTAGAGVNPLKIPLGARLDVNFEIVYRNVGESRLNDVLLIDNYDESVLAILDSGFGVIESDGGDDRLVWGIGDLEPGQAGTVFYSTRLNDTSVDQVIFNNVTLTATTEDGQAVSVSAQGVVIVGDPTGQPPSGWPTGQGCISQGFNVATDPNASHYGVDAIDIAGVTNQAILATHDGVAYVGENARAGKYVRVVSEVSGFSTFYCHLETRAVATGDIIVPGQRIGGMGRTGRTDGGVHVHYEVKKDDTLVTSQYIPSNFFNGCINTQAAGGNCDCCFTNREARCGE